MKRSIATGFNETNLKKWQFVGLINRAISLRTNVVADSYRDWPE